MVIHNLNIKNISGCPGKTHTPLFVDTDAVLVCPVSFQRLEGSCSSIFLYIDIRYITSPMVVWGARQIYG